jgi:hypothetical protein
VKRPRKNTKTITTKDGRCYLTRTPRSAAAGKVVVHNRIHPARPLGMNGFRAWEQVPAADLAECRCRVGALSAPAFCLQRRGAEFPS